MVITSSVNPSLKEGQEAVDVSSCTGTKENTRKKRIVAKEPEVKPTTKDTEEREDVPQLPDNDRRKTLRSSVTQSHVVDMSASCSIDGGTRKKVRELLRYFQATIRKILQKEETNTKKPEDCQRADQKAFEIMKVEGKYVKATKPIIGSVPGVEVGDEFYTRFELMMVGLHRHPQAGIDSVKLGDQAFATSIVDSGCYDNTADSYDVWIYTGQGGTIPGTNKQPQDQKLERGNLALKNSIDKRNLVRVIRGIKTTDGIVTSSKGRSSAAKTYTYYGLYTVERYWQAPGQCGKLEYKFELKRVDGQPELAWKEVNKSKKRKTREGCCVLDISEGKEKIPICAVSTVDGEKPPSFTYITDMIYPDWCKPLPPRVCNCRHRCLDSDKCSCAVKNGGEIPYNNNGAIVEVKRMVYECGPYCKCPLSCSNRVSQRGIKFQLEIFKTKAMGWGGRSLNSIPSGSFICEYIGELIEDKEADGRNEEYLFDIGQNYNDNSLWEGLPGQIHDLESSSGEKVSDVNFTIDAAQNGNVGRFINHSCSPNLYAQSVLYDHDDSRMPHIMFFATENIPPLQELTYDYHYNDPVPDKDGIVKVKPCYCGSSECTGRMN